MSVFFGFLLMVIFYQFFEKKDCDFDFLFKRFFLIYFIISITLNVGYAIKLGSKNVSYNTVLSLLVFFFALPLLFKGRYDKKVFLYGVVFWIDILLGLVLFHILPYKDGIIQNIVDWDGFIRGDVSLVYYPQFPHNLSNHLIAAIRYPLILSVVVKVFSKDDINKATKCILRVLPIVLVYGYFELFVKKIVHFNMTSSLISVIFGNDGLISTSERLNGFTKEPSQYAMVLFLFSLLVISGKRLELYKKTFSFWCSLVAIYFLMLMAGSIVSYYLVIISFLCLILFSNRNVKIFVFVICLFFVFVILIAGVPLSIRERIERIAMVVSSIIHGNRYQSYATSEGARLISIYEMVKCTIARPLFGVGLGVTDAHSTFFSILANIGILGSIVYYMIWFCFIKTGEKTCKYFFYLIIVSTFLVGGLGYFSNIYFPFILFINSNSKKE